YQTVRRPKKSKTQKIFQNKSSIEKYFQKRGRPIQMPRLDASQYAFERIQRSLELFWRKWHDFET
ncbi:MAG: hypothetical protein WBE21_12195, partial [Candidatus Acidiferrales bacterium]